MNPLDDVPVTGGMNTSGNGNTSSNNTRKRDSKTVGYINVTIGDYRVGSVQIETNPYGFATNPVHKSLVELFSYDLTSEELKAEVKELIDTLGIEFTCQLAGNEKNVESAVDYSAKFAGRAKRTIK